MLINPTHMARREDSGPNKAKGRHIVGPGQRSKHRDVPEYYLDDKSNEHDDESESRYIQIDDIQNHF